jgi:hypothetical protein
VFGHKDQRASSNWGESCVDESLVSFVARKMPYFHNPSPERVGVVDGCLYLHETIDVQMHQPSFRREAIPI